MGVNFDDRSPLRMIEEKRYNHKTDKTCGHTSFHCSHYVVQDEDQNITDTALTSTIESITFVS